MAKQPGTGERVIGAAVGGGGAIVYRLLRPALCRARYPHALARSG